MINVLLYSLYGGETPIQSEHPENQAFSSVNVVAFEQNINIAKVIQQGNFNENNAESTVSHHTPKPVKILDEDSSSFKKFFSPFINRIKNVEQKNLMMLAFKQVPIEEREAFSVLIRPLLDSFGTQHKEKEKIIAAFLQVPFHERKNFSEAIAPWLEITENNLKVKFVEEFRAISPIEYAYYSKFLSNIKPFVRGHKFGCLEKINPIKFLTCIKQVPPTKKEDFCEIILKIMHVDYGKKSDFILLLADKLSIEDKSMSLMLELLMKKINFTDRTDPAAFLESIGKIPAPKRKEFSTVIEKLIEDVPCIQKIGIVNFIADHIDSHEQEDFINLITPLLKGVNNKILGIKVFQELPVKERENFSLFVLPFLQSDPRGEKNSIIQALSLIEENKREAFLRFANPLLQNNKDVSSVDLIRSISDIPLEELEVFCENINNFLEKSRSKSKINVINAFKKIPHEERPEIRKFTDCLLKVAYHQTERDEYSYDNYEAQMVEALSAIPSTQRGEFFDLISHFIMEKSEFSAKSSFICFWAPIPIEELKIILKKFKEHNREIDYSLVTAFRKMLADNRDDFFKFVLPLLPERGYYNAEIIEAFSKVDAPEREHFSELVYRTVKGWPSSAIKQIIEVLNNVSLKERECFADKTQKIVESLKNYCYQPNGWGDEVEEIIRTFAPAPIGELDQLLEQAIFLKEHNILYQLRKRDDYDKDENKFYLLELIKIVKTFPFEKRWIFCRALRPLIEKDTKYIGSYYDYYKQKYRLKIAHAFKEIPIEVCEACSQFLVPWIDKTTFEDQVAMIQAIATIPENEILEFFDLMKKLENLSSHSINALKNILQHERFNIVNLLINYFRDEEKKTIRAIPPLSSQNYQRSYSPYDYRVMDGLKDIPREERDALCQIMHPLIQEKHYSSSIIRAVGRINKNERARFVELLETILKDVSSYKRDEIVSSLSEIPIAELGNFWRLVLPLIKANVKQYESNDYMPEIIASFKKVKSGIREFLSPVLLDIFENMPIPQNSGFFGSQNPQQYKAGIIDAFSEIQEEDLPSFCEMANPLLSSVENQYKPLIAKVFSKILPEHRLSFPNFVSQNPHVIKNTSADYIQLWVRFLQQDDPGCLHMVIPDILKIIENHKICGQESGSKLAYWANFVDGLMPQYNAEIASAIIKKLNHLQPEQNPQYRSYYYENLLILAELVNQYASERIFEVIPKLISALDDQQESYKLFAGFLANIFKHPEQNESDQETDLVAFQVKPIHNKIVQSLEESGVYQQFMNLFNEDNFLPLLALAISNVQEISRQRGNQAVIETVLSNQHGGVFPEDIAHLIGTFSHGLLEKPSKVTFLQST